MPISVELWRAAVNRWVARIQRCLIIRRGMKRRSSCASSQEGAPSPSGQSHSGERKCMMKRKGRKKGKEYSFADAALTVDEVYDGPVTPAPISRWFGRVTLTDSSAWNLAGPALKELVCTGLGVLFAVIMILLLKSGDVEPNPGPLEGALPSVPEVLKECEDEFIRVVYPKYNLLKLVRKEVITQDIATRISATNDDEGKEILYHHLKHHGSVHSLREFCEAAMAADGYPNMQKLAEKIVQRLSQGVSEGSGQEPQVRAPPVHHGVSHSSGRGQEVRSEGGPAPVAVKLTAMSHQTRDKWTLEDRSGGSEDQSTSGTSRFIEGDEASSSKDHILLQPVRSCEGYATLLRTYVSRNAADTGRAVMEYLGLSHERIQMCYRTHHYSIEEAVQSGLQEWSVGHCSRPATWKVLLDAMDHGGIACQHIASLRAELLSRTVSERSGREPQIRAPPVRHGVSHSSGKGQELRSEGGPAPVAVKSLRTKLGCYYPRGCVQDNPLLDSSTMEHVRLNLVQPQQRRPIAGRESEAVTVRLARGGAGEVPDVRTPIEYENILTLSLPPGTTRKRVLIEGVAGSGKTTLVQRICHDWSVGRFAQDYDLGIKVTLRSLPKDRKLTLEDLIYTSVGDESDVEEIVQYISSSKGAGVLFVFDGYDEMSEERRQKSIISEVMAGRFAPLSSFVVTTRPISAERLYHCVDRRVEICGFGDEEVKKYITKYFESSNPSAGEKLLSALATRPSIKRLCYIPLLLLMVCFTAARGGDTPEVPPTMHQLYERIIILTVNYNLKRAGKKERARSLQDVMQLCPSFDKVCLLALEGIENDTIIFSNISFEVDAALHGLLNCIEGQDRFGTTTRTWHTLHLTVQEYMAGLAVAKKSPEEHVEFWKNHLTPRYDKEGRFILAEDRYMTTFLFYCGVSGLGNPGIQRMLLDTLGTVVEPAISVDTPLAELCEAASESKNEEFAHSVLSVCGPTVEVQDLNLQGVGRAVAQYCQRVEGVRLTLGSLAHVFTLSELSTFVSQLEPVCSLAAVHLNIYHDAPPAPVDLEYVKQFIQKQKLLKSFGLTVYSLNEEAREPLIDLGKTVVWHHQRSLEEIVVGGGGTFGGIPLDPFVPALLTCPKSSVLKLGPGTLSPANTLMVLEKSTSLQEFVLCDVSVDLWQGHLLTKNFEVSLDKQVQAHPSLKALVVEGDCSLPLVKGAVAGMSKRGNVEKLIVKHEGGLPRETVLQAALIMNTGSLKVLEIGAVTPSQCLRLLKELPHCTRLQKFGIRSTDSQTPTEGETAPSCTAALLEAMLQCVSLEEVVLKRFSFDGIDDAVETFAKHLKDSRVTKLKMTRCREMSSNQIATLCRGLHWSRSLEELCIGYDSSQGKCLQDVSDPGTLQSVEAAVRDNKSLKKMTIFGSELTWTNVAVAILKGAAKNETLRTLRLEIPEPPYPVPELVDEVRRSNPKLQLSVLARQWGKFV